MWFIIIFAIIFILALAFSPSENGKPGVAQEAAKFTVGLVIGVPIFLICLLFLFSLDENDWIKIIFSIIVSFVLVYVLARSERLKGKELEKILSNMENSLANEKAQLQTQYQPIKNFASLNEIDDMSILQKTEQYLQKMLVAQKKHRDFYSNIPKTCDSINQGYCINQVLSSETDIRTYENQIRLVVSRINDLESQRSLDEAQRSPG